MLTPTTPHSTLRHASPLGPLVLTPLPLPCATGIFDHAEIVDEMTSCYVKAAEEDACSMSGSGGVPGSAAASISAPVAPGGALPPGAGTPMHMHMGISGMLASPSPMQQHQAPVQQQAQQQGPVAAPGGPPGQQGMKQEPEGGGVGHKRPPMPAQLPTDVKRQHLPAA